MQLVRLAVRETVRLHGESATEQASCVCFVLFALVLSLESGCSHWLLWTAVHQCESELPCHAVAWGALRLAHQFSIVDWAVR
jgi:hypothetical protein